MTADNEYADAGLHCRVDGPVAHLTLCRPDVRNAQNPALWAAMVQFLDSLGPDVRVVVVRGAEGVFSAGLDLALLDASRAEEQGSLVSTLHGSDQQVSDAIEEYQRPFTMLRDPRFVSVAVVEGPAIGAGFQLALSCDLRVAAHDAWFSMKEPALGLVPDLTGTQPLVEAVGYARALEICATARRVAAEEAARIGLVQAVRSAEELEGAVSALVEALTAHSADAVRATKQLLQGASSRSLDDQQLAERTAQVARFRALAGM